MSLMCRMMLAANLRGGWVWNPDVIDEDGPALVIRCPMVPR
jgi:hypothetical protein